MDSAMEKSAGSTAMANEPWGPAWASAVAAERSGDTIPVSWSTSWTRPWPAATPMPSRTSLMSAASD